MDKPSLLARLDQLAYQANPVFRRAVETAADKHQQSTSILQTKNGPLEYAEAGTGKHVVLIAHSAMGAYDQSLATGRRFPGCRIIAPSRAGYQRTAASTGSTPAEMADTYVELLDALEIDQVIMVGFSAGGMSAVEFALRHPDRCRGLILGAAITAPLPDYVQRLLAPLALSIRSDFLNWLSSQTAALTIPLRAYDADTRAILHSFLQTHPSSERFPGYALDIEQGNHFNPALERINLPTLLVHGTRDTLVPLKQAHEAAARIPDAELVIIQGGGHDCPVLYPEELIPRYASFISSV